MDRNQKRENGNKAQQLIAAGNGYFTRAENLATGAGVPVPPGTYTVDPMVQDIEDRVNAEDKSADVARLEAAGVECYARAKVLIDQVAAPVEAPPA